MIANPAIPAYRYDPYSRQLITETYDQLGMRQARRSAVEKAMHARSFGLILGTLGRQGNPAILKHLEELLTGKQLTYTVLLLSEVTPPKLQQIVGIEVWIQIACPRLSIDWGEGFTMPVLTPYEAEVALGGVLPWWEEGDSHDDALRPYPMNYYEKGGGPWTSSYVKTVPRGNLPKAVLPHLRKKAST
ncbi:hypothetical protein CYMTET_18591 [Cymbomonas tetramitiformis]|uniref:Diphthamide biosynthesis protein 1 n=1 Tax=Cymbomonas tetramitiformis TaxID=36881 RepID=A0AAE0G944_9CHLO|nr:hypothetical protein CYMTET_18591 [Cymbomonas tetramitiformis]